MAEGEATGQISEAWCLVSGHFGSSGRDARETETGRLCQQQMDWRLPNAYKIAQRFSLPWSTYVRLFSVKTVQARAFTEQGVSMLSSVLKSDRAANTGVILSPSPKPQK